MPETRFEDLMVVRLRSADTEVAIDRRFLEVCEPGSILVKSCITNIPMIIGAFVSGDAVVINIRDGRVDERTSAVITISGIRKGRAGRRFPIFTADQAHQNEKFWTQAYDET
jgi:hypothetical protein